MKRIMVAIFVWASLSMDAQYSGRSGIRYLGDGSVFTVRRSNDWSPERRNGRCRIRVRVDDDADVELRGSQLRIRVLRGGPGRDEGSECNAPLPVTGTIRNFRFQGLEGRGNPRLVQQPGMRNFYVAVVNVQDPRGGDEGYTFDLTWDWDRSGAGGGFPGGPPPRPQPPDGPGSLPNMDTSISGSGTLDDGRDRYALTGLSLRVRGDQCQITMTTDRWQRFEMSGRVSGNTPRCLIESSNRGKTSANAFIVSEGMRLRGVDVGGSINGRNFTANFRGR